MAGLVISTDLLFADSLCQRARMMGKQLEMRSLAAALDWPEPAQIALLLVDLSSLNGAVEESIASLKSTFPNTHLTAFGPHVHEALLEAATLAGCDEVLTRGQMNQQAGRCINRL